MVTTFRNWQLACLVATATLSSLSAQADETEGRVRLGSSSTAGIVRISDQPQNGMTARGQSPTIVDDQVVPLAHCEETGNVSQGVPPSPDQIAQGALGQSAPACPEYGSQNAPNQAWQDPNCPNQNWQNQGWQSGTGQGWPNGAAQDWQNCPSQSYTACPEECRDNHNCRNDASFYDRICGWIHDDIARKKAWLHGDPVTGYVPPSRHHQGPPRPLFGKYHMVYANDPAYFDGRDGQVYAAAGYGGPVSVPLAPVVHDSYNYGWGVPSSRLTPVLHPATQAPISQFPSPVPTAPVAY